MQNIADQLKILICYHKPYNMPQNDNNIFLPIHCGRALTDLDLHIQPDNSLNGRPCDNISEKNPYYSELTALYWAWKNIKILYSEIKYIGLMHYRRFFAFDESKFFTEEINKPESEILNYKIDLQQIINILESGKIILVRRQIFPFSAATQYNESHFSEDLRVLENIIASQFSEYYPAFNKIMNHNKLSARNMFIMKYEDFCDYCEWLFAVLDEIDKRINYQVYYSPYQIRVPAFMSERLFNVYMLNHEKKAKFLNVYFYVGGGGKHKSLIHKIILFIIDIFSYLRDELTALLLYSRFKIVPKIVSIIRKIFKREK